MEIVRLGPGDEPRIVAARHLFDEAPRHEWTHRLLTTEGHHLLLADVDGVDVGFVSGVEMTHPDKGTEMFVYELGVDDAYQRQGIGRALVEALATIAQQEGCYGMWVLTDDDNAAALATYERGGATRAAPQVQLEWTFGDPPPG
jgi:ribosomal protein S18 acetylase RimI-like enzyme